MSGTRVCELCYGRIVKSTETYCCIGVLSGSRDCYSRVLLCDPLAFTLFTRVSHTKQAFFSFHPYTQHHRSLFSLFYVHIFPLIHPISHTILVTILLYNSQQNSLVLLTCIILLLVLWIKSFAGANHF